MSRSTPATRPAPRATLRLRAVRRDDTAGIVALMRAVFKSAAIDARIAARFGGPPWHRVKMGAVRRQLADNPAGCFVAVTGDRIVGYVSTSVNVVADRGWIIDLAVAAEYQGRGLGRRLINRALDHFRALGLHHAKIETLDTNLAGQHLYPALGFVEIARQIHYVMPLTEQQCDS
jgi:ribosomal protein S18 acetylase RimI-like enzyme